MKKILYLMLILLGIASIVYSVIQYRIIYNDFWKHEMYFINGYLDTILIVLRWVGICLIMVGALGLRKILKRINVMSEGVKK